MDEFVCPWCGEDLMPLLGQLKPCPYDAVYEAHAMECAPLQQELVPEEGCP